MLTQLPSLYVYENINYALKLKAPCKAVTANNVAALTGTTTIDGVALVANDRVLLVGQLNPIQNGIWVINSGTWTRPNDFAVGGSASSAYCFIDQGSVYADTGWLCVSDSGADIIGTNQLVFIQFSASGQLVFTNGLTKSNFTVSNDLSTGIAGGQTITGGTGATDTLTIRGSSNASYGSIKIQSNSLAVETIAVANFTASTEVNDILFNLGKQSKGWAAGNITTQRDLLIKPRTYTFASASTVTTAATLAIEGSPVAGTNATITSANALWVQAGQSRFDGVVQINNTLSVTTNSVIFNTFSNTTTTQPIALALNAGTNATVGITVQNSPGILWRSNVWESTGGTSQVADFLVQMVGASGTAASGALTFYSRVHTGALTNRFSIGTNGTVSVAQVMSFANTATAPSTSVDKAQLYSADAAGAGTTALALYQEYAPIATADKVATHEIPLIVNGTTYYVLARNAL